MHVCVLYVTPVHTHLSLLQDELDLSAAKREGVLALPPEAKWRLYLNQKFVRVSCYGTDSVSLL